MSLKSKLQRVVSPPLKRAEQSAWAFTLYKAMASRFGQENLFSLVETRMPGLDDLLGSVSLNRGMIDRIALDAAKAEELFDAPEIVFQAMDYASLAFPYPAWYAGSLAVFWIASEAISQARKTESSPVRKVRNHLDLLKAGFYHMFRNYPRAAEICSRYPDDAAALDCLTESCFRDLEGKGRIEGNSVEYLMDRNVWYCRLSIDDSFFRVLTREDLVKRISRLEPKLDDDMLASQQYMTYLFVTGRTSRFFNAWDTAFEHSLQADMALPPHGYIKEEMLDDFFEHYSDKAQLSMDYLSFLVDVAGLYAKRDSGSCADALGRRDRALCLMYRIAKKREDATRSDLERLGESKNYAAVVRKRGGESSIVFKEGGDLKGEMDVTLLMKDLVCDEYFRVPEPISIFEVDTGLFRTEVYAMERVDGRTLEQMIEDGEDVTGHLVSVAGYLGRMHSRLAGYGSSRPDPEDHFLSLVKKNENIPCPGLSTNLGPLTDRYKDSYCSMKLDPHIGNFILCEGEYVKIDNEKGIERPVHDDFALFVSFAEIKKGTYGPLLTSNLYTSIKESYLGSALDVSEDGFDLEYLNSNIRVALTLYSHYSNRSQKSKNLYNRVIDRAIQSIDEIEANFGRYYGLFRDDYHALKHCMEGMFLT